ncbi:toxin-activating lysine-acyltransferase [Izhakiella australiensis]|uniref:RTX toxin-activating lysine-acyltransferase n=1 Tax=Izhakiella australiensis TaxID=1926881 RepID=A0A1S8Y6G7_9GAMM|nr:toxin-activating lysine-acyltransferase [Izhakiella australiensis]OON34699.1 toxin-activating lysine-acyltransferase [Izhakiella australiensis]
MRWRNYLISAPFLLGDTPGEAEILGAAVWLWMHSPMHRETPLNALSNLLLPVIKSQQYMLASRDNRPVFFCSWAWMDEASEHRYLTQPAIMTRQSDWTSGDRLWIRDWIAPFGDTICMSRLILAEIFPYQCMRSLYHRGATCGQRVMNFRGSQISREQARIWRQQHPVTAALPE